MYGRLLSGGVHPAADPVLVAELIHPPRRARDRVRHGRGRRGPGGPRRGARRDQGGVLRLEIIDSRYADFSSPRRTSSPTTRPPAARRARPDPRRPRPASTSR